MLILSIGFAHLPLNPIAVDGVLKPTFGYANHHLYGGYCRLFVGRKGLHQIHHPQGKGSERPAICTTKELFGELFATGALFFS